ncbi:MAG: response regulator [Planctomycetota bacterium]
MRELGREEESYGPLMMNLSDKTLDTLRLSPRQIESLLDELQQPRFTDSAGHANRESERFFFTELSGVPLDIVHPGGSDARFSVIPTDLSATGMGLLHGGFLHRGTPVVATLSDMQGSQRRIEGHVTQCLLHSGRVHRIGVVFDDPIELSDFLRLDDQGNETMQGRVLHLDDSSNFRRVFKHHCEKIGVTVTEAETVDEAVKAVGASGFGVAYIDLHLDESDGLEALERLREAGYEGPAVLLTGDESQDVADRARAAGMAQVLIKPVMPDAIRSSLARHLEGEDTDATPIVSSMWEETDLRPMIERLVGGLTDRVAELTMLIQSDDAGWRATCRDLKSEVGVCGFAELSELFRQVEAVSDASDQSVADTLRQVEGMVKRIQTGIQPG